MDISFRRVSNQESFRKTITFLTEDVKANGGSAGEIVNMHGTLVRITICAVPWGTILIREDVTKLEALAWWWSDIE